MANPEHLELLHRGVDVWNAWRSRQPSIALDLGGANLSGADLSRADLVGVNLAAANVWKTSLRDANLSQANLRGVDLTGSALARADLSGADLSGANLSGADMTGTDLREANLREANLRRAVLIRAVITRASLTGADLTQANMTGTDLREANLREANLRGAVLIRATMTNADLGAADLSGAILVETNLDDANVSGCRIYRTSASQIGLHRAVQENLIISNSGEAEITVDGMEVAQLINLLLDSETLRSRIVTLGLECVVLLGRFTEGRALIVDLLRKELRKRNYIPITMNFDKPETKDFTQIAKVLIELSRFVIADVTNPKSAPVELQATVRTASRVPIAPIIQEGEGPFHMLSDLLSERPDVLPVLMYSSPEALVKNIDKTIIEPSLTRAMQLQRQYWTPKAS